MTSHNVAVRVNGVCGDQSMVYSPFTLCVKDTGTSRLLQIKDGWLNTLKRYMPIGACYFIYLYVSKGQAT